MISLDFFTIQTPGLLFPTATLLLLAYSTRFLGITSVIRKLHEDMNNSKDNHNFYMDQIQSLTARIELIVNAQKSGTLSMILCLFSMAVFCFSIEASVVLFAIAMVLILVSLMLIFKELTLSLSALNFILNDCERIDKMRQEEMKKEKEKELN